MITTLKSTVYGTDKLLAELAGKSTDTKPTENLALGCSFLEVDTGDIYLFDGETWIKQFSLQE